MRTFTTIACLCAVLSMTSTAEAAVDLTPEEIGKLARGGLVVHPLPGSGQNSTIAGASYAIVDAPPDVIMNALRDVSAWIDIFPNTLEVQSVAKRGDIQVVKVIFGNRLITLEFHLMITFRAGDSGITFALDQNRPRDVREVKGSVTLIPQPGGRTLVAFTALTKLPFGGLIKVMGKKVVHWIEHRVLSVPKRLKVRVEGPAGEGYRSDAPGD